MSNNDYKNYRYDDFDYERPSTGRYGTETRRRSNEPMPDFLYDARGTRVKKPKKVSKEFLQTLLIFAIYLIVNGTILAIVTATPKIKIEIDQTDDYQSVTAHFKINSLLPLENMVVTMESEELPYVKSGNNYTALITRNGTFYVEATAVNGMKASEYSDVSVLDDTPPTIDDSSCHIEEGILTFDVADTQSGINWSQVYALAPDGTRVIPKKIDKTTGTVSMPMDVDTLELHVSDMVGNERTATVTATTEQLTVNGPVVE